MSEFKFGQPEGGIIQTAFITDDIERDMAALAKLLNIGPWFLFENFPLADLQHRGAPADFSITLALGNSGHMQFELIQQLDDKPSVYREVQAERGWGFHHYGIGVRDFDAARASYEGQGYEMALYGVAGVGARAAYFDTLGDAFGMVELIEMTDAVEDLWQLIQDASRGWDGKDPVRTLA